MDTLSTKPALAALAKLAALATRVEITGASSPREKSTSDVAHRALDVLSGLLEEAVEPSTPQATQKCFRRLARTLLKAQTLHAAARQAAAAAAVLSAERGPGQGAVEVSDGTAGAVPDASMTFRLRAVNFACCTARLAWRLAALATAFNDKALGRALLAALRESSLLSHVGRLLLLLPPLPAAEGGPPLPAAAEGGPPPPAVEGVLSMLCYTVDAVCDLEAQGTEDDLHDAADVAVEDDSRNLAGTYGPCAQHAVLTLWAATLAAADLQPCGLPYNLLPSPPHTKARGGYPCIDGIVAHQGCVTLCDDQLRDSAARSVSPRAAARLLRRSLALAAASARAAGNSRAVRHGPSGILSVDVGWDGRREGRAEFRYLVEGADAITLVRDVVRVLREIDGCSPRAFVAEAASMWAPLFAAVRHSLPLVREAEQAELCAEMGKLLVAVAGIGQTDGGTPPTLAFHPSQLPPAVVAALEGGVVPLLETVFRAAGDNPRGPEARMAASCLADASDWRAVMAAALTHSPPRQAAAFLATLAKLLRRTQARSLLGAAEAPPAVTASCAAVEGALNALRMAPSCVEPPGPLDPAAPCAPLFVHAAAALLLLPELSRLTREALELQLAMPERSRRNTAAGQGALAQLLAVLAEAVDLGSRTPDCPEEGQAGGSGRAPTRLSSALCLPLLVEEAGAVPLLGAALALLQRHGSLPLEGPDGDTWATLGGGCLRLGDAFPELVRGRPAGSGSAAGAAWQPGAVRLLGAKLGEEEWAELRGALEGLAARLEQGCGSGAGPSGGAGSTAAWQLESERLAALRAELRSVLPACSNPACVSLAGDSEAGLRLHPCGGCGRAAYCCEQCRGAHWKAGHKKACGREGQGGG